MQCLINYKQKYDEALLYTIDKLPKDFATNLMKYINEKNIFIINEIRIKEFSNVVLIINQKNIQTDIFVSHEIIEKIVLTLCDGSLYAHLHTIKDGYISIGNGIRAGICGKAIMKDGQIEGIYDISSINIRIPQRIKNAGQFVFNYLVEKSLFCSVILYSPPGVGKTTVLRDLVVKLSKAQIRHAIIDTREEITPFLKESLTADIFLAYPKEIAIDMATKSMTPQIIICDEITTLQEAESIKHTINSGVSFVATTHARTFDELKTKEMLKPLLSCHAFDAAIGICRGSNNNFKYTINEII